MIKIKGEEGEAGRGDLGWDGGAGDMLSLLGVIVWQARQAVALAMADGVWAGEVVGEKGGMGDLPGGVATVIAYGQQGVRLTGFAAVVA